jgi:hypothetical protein
MGTVGKVKSGSCHDGALTVARMLKKAKKGRFYDLGADSWVQTGRLEQVVRRMLSTITSFVDSPEQAAVRRTFQACERLETPPDELMDSIEEYLEQSLKPDSPLYPASSSIAALFTRAILSEGTSLEVEQDATKRLFTIKKDGADVMTAVSSAFAVLDFYYPDNQKLLTNIHDDLLDSSGQNLAHISFAPREHLIEIVTTPEWLKASDITGADHSPLATVQPLSDNSTYLFRDATTGKVMAIATHTKKTHWNWLPTQSWQVAIRSQTMPVEYYAWAILKYTQTMLPGPNSLPYVRSWP